MVVQPPSLTALSTGNRCLRGELLLSDDELQQVHAYLLSHNSNCRFELVGAEGISEEGSHRRRKIRQREEGNQRDQTFKRLPKWTREIHQALTDVLRERHITPTYSAIESTWPPLRDSAVHRDFVSKLGGAPEPLSMTTLLMKLEQSHYRTPLEALNDIYNVWLCDFRYFEPGSIIWAEVYRRAKAFQDKINKLGLDSFEKVPERPPAVVEPVLPVSCEERTTMCQILENLSADQHVALYEIFRNTACWTEVNPGDMELDETNTAPEVFREMLQWCRDQAQSI
ncbi:MAG: hypothetical protein KVP17_002573 [Porospora cf. gigantea B]|uniref:uncharacterized protein n=1 Tax=Porospora cf. gigantea B TaxID=2853592 RepID=UPI003571C601|nr:MAG: hypothetical protein KVP17_002573 [Porospora cf. gigantea B]